MERGRSQQGCRSLGRKRSFYPSFPLLFSRSVVSDSVTPWTAARQAPLSFTVCWSLLKLLSIESVMPSNRFIHCRLLFLLPSLVPSIRVFSKESVLRIRWPKCWSSNFSISPSNEYSGLICPSLLLELLICLFRCSGTDWVAFKRTRVVGVSGSLSLCVWLKDRSQDRLARLPFSSQPEGAGKTLSFPCRELLSFAAN